MRRRKNEEMGGPEHPRAATTDDVECFISCIRNDIGPKFTVKEFQKRWKIICREFSKRLDNSLPFYYWSTKQDRFSEGEMPSFDILPQGETPRLERTRVRRRELLSTIVSDRTTLPSQTPSVRTQFHNLPIDLPPPPMTT